jgi:hypothetical protein
MSRKLQVFLSVTLTVMMVLLLVVTPVLAAEAAAPATGMAAAAGPLPGWVKVEPGATQWYRFKYSYDNSKNDNTPEQALVELRTAAPANVIFEVWTPGRLTAPLKDPTETHQEGTFREPVGMGTPVFLESVRHWEGPAQYRHADYTDVYDMTHLVWAGSAKATDTYYIVVKNKGVEPASYQLTITGPTVSF